MRYFYVTFYKPCGNRGMRTITSETRTDVLKWLRISKCALICLLELTEEEHKEYNEYYKNTNVDDAEFNMEEAVKEKRM